MIELQVLTARFNAYSGNLIAGKQYPVIEVDDSRNLVRVLSTRQRQVWIPFSYFTGFIHPEFELQYPNDCTQEPNFDPLAPHRMDVGVQLSDGRYYNLSVWNYAYLRWSLLPEVQDVEGCSKNYLLPPDFLLSEMTKTDLQEAIQDIICEGSLETLASKTDMSLVFIAPWADIYDLPDEEVEMLEQRVQACLIAAQHPLADAKFSLYAYHQDTHEVLLRSGKGALALFILPKTAEAPLSVVMEYDSMQTFWEKRYREEYRTIMKNRGSNNE